MQKSTLLALALLTIGSELRAQFDEEKPVYIRWSVMGGRPTVRTSGRTTKLIQPSQCFSCAKIEEYVSGADEGLANLGIVATGIPGRIGLALRMEININLNGSDPYISPTPSCASLVCKQPRKAEADNAFMLGVGMEYAPFDSKIVSPYVVVGGGLGLNKLAFRQDSSTSSALTGNAVSFGPFVAAGGGIRATFRNWTTFIEWRQFTTFVTPGSQMTPLNFGVQYRSNRAFGVGA